MNTNLSQAQKDFIAGWAGGIAQVLSGQPFDILKVRMQTSATSISMPAMIQKMVKDEGYLSFYKGTLTPLLGIGACVSIQFGALESLKRKLCAPDGSLTYPQLFLAGAGSGLANSVVSCPVELVRIRLQMQKGASSVGPLALIQNMVRGEHGVASLFKGMGVTTVREFFGYGIYFLTYEAGIKNVLAANPQYKNERSAIPSYLVVAFGAMSGVTLWTLTFPIDVIKTRIQTDLTGRYKSAFDCVRATYAEGGFSAFYRGFTPCLLRSMPVNAITFVAFEQAMKVLNKV